ncbi:MAG: hypothetical protein U0Q22_00065 [Acidimicrobiales bacterium]
MTLGRVYRVCGWLNRTVVVVVVAAALVLAVATAAMVAMPFGVLVVYPLTTAVRDHAALLVGVPALTVAVVAAIRTTIAWRDPDVRSSLSRRSARERFWDDVW